MSTQDIREQLINKIKETKDTLLLQEVSTLFELSESESIFQVNNVQRERIDEAVEQIKNQQTLSNEQADKETDEWLNK